MFELHQLIFKRISRVNDDSELDETCHSGNALLNIDEEQQKNLEQINSVAKLQNVPTVLDLPPCYIATDKYPVELWKHQG